MTNFIQSLPVEFAQARQAFSTRRVPRAEMCGLMAGNVRPTQGDLVLARVQRLGQHRQIEQIDGRKSALHPGVLVILAYGNRYAPDQFEALVPFDLGPCDLVAGGGLAARAIARHEGIAAATQIQPLGLLTDAQGTVLNLSQYRLPERQPRPHALPVTVVCGTSMNAGKTFSAAMLVRGLRAHGKTVAAFKVTGTASGNDLWTLHDAGADTVLDFVDVGLPSTYGASEAALVAAFEHLLAACQGRAVDAVVVEVADGLGQAETAALLRSETLRRHVSAILFAAPDPMGAAAGARWLQAEGLPLVAISGLTTARPLDQADAAACVDVPVLSAEELAAGDAWKQALAGRLLQSVAGAA